MNDALKRETERPARSWMQHAAAHLRGYFVAGVEEPRVNVQSVLPRHFLLAALFEGKFDRLMEEELRFATVMNWLQRNAVHLETPGARTAPLHSPHGAADNSEGLEIPAFVTRTFAGLPVQIGEFSVPNYVDLFLAGLGMQRNSDTTTPSVLNTFQGLWAKVLEGEIPQAVQVLEPACGSANDYRCLAGYGIARPVDYLGFDLCEKNVQNARASFPGVQFKLGNVFKIPAADDAFELSFVHDLFEHLSLEALPVAVGELCRVTSHGLCASFFQMNEIPEPIIRPVDEYHWNTLSLARTQALFAEQGFEVQPLHIGSYLRWRIGCAETHNSNAYIFLAFRK